MANEPVGRPSSNPPPPPVLPGGPIARYLRESERPLASLAFVLPLVILYEAGTRWLVVEGGHSAESRIVAFTLAEWFFGWSVGHFTSASDAVVRLLPPVAVAAVLTAAHLSRRDVWTLRKRVPIGMTCESVVWAIPLLLLPTLGERLLTSLTPQEVRPLIVLPTVLLGSGNLPASEDFSGSHAGFWTYWVIFGVGAGVYEELVFRVAGFAAIGSMLLGIPGVSRRAAALTTMLLCAIAFAGYHHLHGVGGLGGEPFDAAAFAFRTLAGVWFGLIYLARGFGVTAGCHAAYDLILGMLIIGWRDG